MFVSIAELSHIQRENEISCGNTAKFLHGRIKRVFGCGFRDTKKWIHWRNAQFRIDERSIYSVDRLYFVTFKNNYKPHNTSNTLYFTIDDEFHYENFFHDFGPLDICMLYYYCNRLNEFLADRTHAKKKIIHYTSTNEEKRLNAAYLIGAFGVKCAFSIEQLEHSL